jgi:hypothetical protein
MVLTTPLFVSTIPLSVLTVSTTPLSVLKVIKNDNCFTVSTTSLLFGLMGWEGALRGALIDKRGWERGALIDKMYIY